MRVQVGLPDDLTDEELYHAIEVLEQAADLIRKDHKWKCAHKKEGKEVEI